MDVRIDCPCLGTPHESDTVTLRDRLDFRTVTTIRKSMTEVETEDPKVRFAERMAAVTEFYMLMGIEQWTLVDAHGKPVPVSHQAVRDLWETVDVLPISEAAEDLYNPVVLLPLVKRASISSPPTPTDESISAPMDSEPKLPRPSKRSLTTTIPTDGTETTSLSLVGGSNTSQNSVTAA